VGIAIVRRAIPELPRLIKKSHISARCHHRREQKHKHRYDVSSVPLAFVGGRDWIARKLHESSLAESARQKTCLVSKGRIVNCVGSL